MKCPNLQMLNEYLNTYVEEARNYQGYTFKELAELLKTTPQAVNNWTKSRRNWSLDTLLTLTKLLGIELLFKDGEIFIKKDKNQECYEIMNNFKLPTTSSNELKKEFIKHHKNQIKYKHLIGPLNDSKCMDYACSYIKLDKDADVFCLMKKNNEDIKFIFNLRKRPLEK